MTTPKKQVLNMYCTKDGTHWYAFKTKKDATKSLTDTEYDGGLIGEICEKWDNKIELDKFNNLKGIVHVKLELMPLKQKTCPQCHVGYVDVK